MCQWDGNYDTEFSSSVIRKAKKVHRCDECRRDIQPGEMYKAAAGKSEGYMWSAKQCAHCQVVAAVLSEHCGGYLYEGVHEDIHEHVTERAYWAPVAKRLDGWMSRKWQRHDGAGLIDIPDAEKLIARCPPPPPTPRSQW